MVEQAIHFNDGDVYERTMGVWSRLAGELFLDWLNPRPGMRWIDVGCGSGAFTELLVQRCTPAEALGIDPSEAQLAFARTRPRPGRQGAASAAATDQEDDAGAAAGRISRRWGSVMDPVAISPTSFARARITRARKTLGGHQGALVAEAIYSLFASFLRLLSTHF